MKCPKCGYEIYEGEDYCSICGYGMIETEIEDEEYEFTEEFITCDDTLIKYNGNEVNVVIPDTIKTIHSKAFKDCECIEKLVLGKNVTIIDSEAFMNCINLVEIEFNEKLTKIDTKAFYKCEALKYIELPNTLNYVGDFAFCYCTNLLDVYCPSDLDYLGKSAFAFCENLYSFDLPNVKVLSKGLLYGCKSYEYINLPSNLEKIEDYAINNTGIKEINIPAKVKEIDTFGLKNSQLVTINVHKKSLYFYSDDGILYTKGRGISLKKYPQGRKTESFKLPTDKEVNIIYGYAFDEVEALKEFSAADNLGMFSSKAFNECPNLKKITDVKTVTSYQEEAFYYCTNLEEIDYAKSLKYIESNAFKGCKNLKSVTVNVKCDVKVNAIPDGCKLKKKLF